MSNSRSAVPAPQPERPHRKRKRSNRSQYTWLWRAAGVLVLLSIFAALWYWNRKVQNGAPSPLEDTSVSRPG